MKLQDVPSLLVQGLQAQSAGDLALARLCLTSLLDAEPRNPAALYSLAALDDQEGKPTQALERLDAAIGLRQDVAAFYVARAQVKSRLGQGSAALLDARQALKLEPGLSSAKSLLEQLREQSKPDLMAPEAAYPADLMQLVGKAQALQGEGRLDAALACYANYLANGDPAFKHVMLYSAGVALAQSGRSIEAEAYMRQCAVLKPDFMQAQFALGQMMEANGRVHDALAQWQQVLSAPQWSGPTASAAERALRVQVLNQIGRASESIRDFPAAEAALAESLQLQPAQAPVLHHWIHLRQKQCAWPVIPGSRAVKREALQSASALAMLGLSDDPAEQLASAQRYVQEKVVRIERYVPKGHRYGHDRLRIGYLSSDLSMHAVSLLTVELFEKHNRDRVEVHAFCWSREDGTPFRERVRRAFDRFHRIDQMDDEAAARLIQSQEIDVLVDLHGLTSNARPNIVARGPAPMQVAFLGFPGPTALPHMDYVVADSFIFPPELEAGFTEKPLRLPTLYQCSDSQRPIGRLPQRAELGLPDDQFVFCAFNNNFKFTPEVFESWMRILRQVPQSVLWLLEDNPWSRHNLEQAARSHGVDPQRLIFAGRVPPADYLARFTAADLFLDTYPYNAGTTANDALWAGLPLLTLSGRTYVSRMAGSLLTSAGLTELVTTSLADYEKRAVEMALNPTRLQGLRTKLTREKSSGRLFSTQRFADEFETAIAQAWSAAR